MFNIREVASICMLFVSSQTAICQSPTFLTNSAIANEVEKNPNGKTKLSTYRVEELARRAHEPAATSTSLTSLIPRAEYSVIVSGDKPLAKDDILRIKNAKAMPPTDCSSIYLVHKNPEKLVKGPWSVHDSNVNLFVSQSGFGFFRMLVYENSRGQLVGAPGIDRVELVSLLTTDEPMVYVLDELPIPPKARLAQRRPLDKFEQLGLDAVRRGNDLVASNEAPNRMFGAIRAEENCLECHSGAKKNDLLGAFSYYLETTVDKLGAR